MRTGRCRQCGEPTKGRNEYLPQTCGRSECQQADVCDNHHMTNRKRKQSCPAGKGCKRWLMEVSS